jgi:hypothetical protein
MKQKSKSHGRAAKSRVPKSGAVKRGSAAKAAGDGNRSGNQEPQAPQLTHELHDALEQLTTTAEILEVISNSLSDTQPVFDAIVQSGVRLIAIHGASKEYCDY